MPGSWGGSRLSGVLGYRRVHPGPTHFGDL